jgi:hypothetical protein
MISFLFRRYLRGVRLKRESVASDIFDLSICRGRKPRHGPTAMERAEGSGGGGNIITNPEGERIEVIRHQTEPAQPPPTKPTIIRRPCMHLAR